MRTVICIPTYNECDNLAPLVEEILASIDAVDVMVIDGHSTDGTADIARDLAKKSDRVSLVQPVAGGSVATAYAEGFRQALRDGYEQIVQMDADFSHQPRYLKHLLEGLQTSDVVIGSRYVAGGSVDQWSLARRLVSRAGNVYVGTVLQMPYQDTTSGFVAFRRHVLEAVDFEELQGEGRAFQVELKYRAHRLGFTITEVPIHFWDRVVGSSKLTTMSAVDSLVNVLKVRLKGD